MEKKHCFLFVLFVYAIPLQGTSLTLKGEIVAPNLNTTPPFKVYYQGMQTKSNEDGFFSFPLEEKKKEKYALIICKDFVQQFDSINTIKGLKINPAKPYKLFTIKKATIPVLQQKIHQLEQNLKPTTMRLRLIERQIQRQHHNLSHFEMSNKLYQTHYDIAPYQKKLHALKGSQNRLKKQSDTLTNKIALLKKKYQELQNASNQEEAGDFWLITQKTLAKKRNKIPDNCVVVCLNPKIVHRIENRKYPLAPNFVAFPRLILKQNLETKNVKRKKSIIRSSHKSELYSFDTQVFHEPKKEELRSFANQPEVKVALTR